MSRSTLHLALACSLGGCRTDILGYRTRSGAETIDGQMGSCLVGFRSMGICGASQCGMRLQWRLTPRADLANQAHFSLWTESVQRSRKPPVPQALLVFNRLFRLIAFSALTGALHAEVGDG